MKRSNTHPIAYVMAVVVLVAIVGLVSTSKAPQLEAPAVVVEPQAPQLTAAQQAAMKKCDESYDYRFALCNRRTHKESVEVCLNQANWLQEDCVSKI